jgi:hypothetical protein
MPIEPDALSPETSLRQQIEQNDAYFAEIFGRLGTTALLKYQIRQNQAYFNGVLNRPEPPRSQFPQLYRPPQVPQLFIDGSEVVDGHRPWWRKLIAFIATRLSQLSQWK